VVFLNASKNEMDPNFITVLLGYLLFMFFVGCIFYGKHNLFHKYGLIGIFLGNLISSVSIFSPGSWVICFLGGRIYNPLIVGFFAALGCVVGETVAYNVGSAGNSAIQNMNWFKTINDHMNANGFLTIYVVTALPNPIANASALLSGSLHFPFVKFLFSSFLGNWTQWFLVACAGKVSKRIPV